MDDLTLIAGRFLDNEVPRGKEYLLHYFSKPLQRAFLAYYFAFPGLTRHSTSFFHRLFCEHTGASCSLRRLQTLLKRVRDIETTTKAVADTCDLTQLHKIKTGKAHFGYFKQ